MIHWCARTLLLDLAMRIDSESALTLLGLVTSQAGTDLPLFLVKILSFVHKILMGAPFFRGLSGAPWSSLQKKISFRGPPGRKNKAGTNHQIFSVKQGV